MPTANTARVVGDLRHLQKQAAYKTGVHRPSLSKEHLASLHWLETELKAIGHRTVIDGLGNVFGFSDVKGPKILAGSHLESQNYAGWLDGPLGVVYALEAARAIKADPAFAGCGVDVGSWFDEEGHFGSFLGSRSAVGEVTQEEIGKAIDRTTGTPLPDALKAAGFGGRPLQHVDPKAYVGYFEAHIEQGDWLEAHKLKIGVVTSIVGIHQFRITFTGQQNHAGTTRMAIRRDTGLAAAKLCVAIDEHMPSAAGPRSVWTTGRIALEPGDPSVIPGRTQMLFQVRDADQAVLKRMEALVMDLIAKSNAKGPCQAEVEVLRRSIPAVMADKFQLAVEGAAEKAAPGLHTRIPSGAGHDAQIFARHMPSGMMFVPSIGGISHHWTENTSDEDIGLGAQVFVDAVARLLKS